MKTSTLLKKLFTIAGFLILLLVVISFKSELPASGNSFNFTEELKNQDYNSIDLALFVQNDNIEEVEPKDADVILRIDTNGINEHNLDSKIIFVNVGDTTSTGSGNPKEFLTTVYKNKKISWRGEPQDPNSDAIIDILNIERKSDGGAKLLRFGTKEHKNKKVEIKVKDKKIDGLEYYNVRFSITEGDEVRIFEVDPKLEMGR